MRILISVITLLLLITGCTNPNIASYEKASKKQLISSANNGDIKAMVALNKYYDYPQTKEGFDYYKKWYKDISSKDNSKDIIAFAKVFSKYADMFINHRLKYEHLLKLAGDDKEAQWLLFEFYQRHTMVEKEVLLKDKILKTATNEDLRKLYDNFSDHLLYSKAIAKNIYALMKKRGMNTDFIDFEKLYNDEKNVDKILNKIYTSNNLKNILEVAKVLKKDGDINTYKFYKKALELSKKDETKAKIYFDLYTFKHYKNAPKDIKANALANLEKSAALGYKKAKRGILFEYSKKEKYKKQYNNLVNEYLKTTKGKKFLADVFEDMLKIDEATKLYEELAKLSDEDAIIKLAFNKIGTSYLPNKDGKEKAKTWKEYLIKHPKKSLYKKAQEVIYHDIFKKFDSKLVNAVIAYDLKENNIITFRKLSKKYHYTNKKLKFEYLKKAADLGDTKSILSLVENFYFKKRKTIQKGIDLLEELSDKGSYVASYDLSNLYLYPNSKQKKYKNVKKGLYYQEKSANQGKTYLYGELYTYYFNKKDYKNALKYANLFASKGKRKAFFILGKLYYKGTGVKQDLLKAKEYFQKAAKFYYSDAFYELGLLYFKHSKIKIKTDNKKALEYFKQGAEFYNTNCIYSIGDIYNEGLIGVKKDKEKAISYYKELASRDEELAYYIAYYYANDKKDFKNAFKYFKMSLNKTTGKGYYEIAYLYENGLGTKQDVNNALEHYYKAYKVAGNNKAAFKIATILHYGKGNYPKNLKLAKDWYEGINTKEAKAELKKLEKELK